MRLHRSPLVIALASVGLIVGAALIDLEPAPPVHEPVKLLARENGGGSFERSPFGIAQHDRELPPPQGVSVPPKPSRAAEVARLWASADSRDAWHAYQLVDACVRAREVEASAAALPLGPPTAAAREAMASGWESAAQVCDDISAAQIAQRLHHLDVAAAAGVPGAAVALAAEGPFGDRDALAQRPDDPLVVAWKQRVVELMQASAKNGDKDALLALANQYRSADGLVARDPQRALAYWAAQRDIAHAAGARTSRGAGKIAAAWSEGLSEEQIAAAIADGQTLAAQTLK